MSINKEFIYFYCSFIYCCKSFKKILKKYLNCEDAENITVISEKYSYNAIENVS